MDRDFDHDIIIDTNQDRARTTDQGRQERLSSGSKIERPASGAQDRQAPDERTVYELRGKSYRLNDREARMLSDIGAFRAIDKADLLRHIYKGEQEVFDRDLRHLHRQNLVRIVGPKGSVTKYIALTKPAQQVSEKYLRTNERQQIYAGAVKTRELKHDATLYRLYEKVAGEMEDRGQKPIRVVLDYELKRHINKALAKTKELSRQQKEERIRKIAQAAQPGLGQLNGFNPRALAARTFQSMANCRVIHVPILALPRARTPQTGCYQAADKVSIHAPWRARTPIRNRFFL